MKKLLLVLCLILAFQANGLAAKIGDISDVQGIRSNPLTGYGLVVGLNGTGDNSLPS
ncbi:MAG: flagellar basal body P-ring protein FlgI, partial [Planctomycetota bacterium]